MKIDSSHRIAGYPILRIRDLFKKQKAFCLESIEWCLKVPSDEADRVLAELLALGYLEPMPAQNPFYPQGAEWFDLTQQGRTLALARALPPLSREKVERLLQEFMSRVEEVNANPIFLYKVTRVIIFGSYLRPEASELNDLDLVVETRFKLTDTETRHQAEEACRQAAQAAGRTFPNYSAYLYWPEIMVRLFLSSKSKYLSFHNAYDDILEQATTKQLYPVEG